MAKKSLHEVSQKLRNLDLCMMTTITKNNGDVEYDGNSYFFTWRKSRLAKDLKKNSHVNLAFNGKKALFVSVAGKAKLSYWQGEEQGDLIL
jgi:general stress protein 26